MTLNGSTKTLFSIFHLDSERGLRGGERQLLYLATYLRRQGHDNTVVCRKGSPLDAEARRLGLNTLHLPFFFEWDPVSAIWLRWAARKTPHHVILHAHTAHGAALAYLTSRLGGPRWITHRRVDFSTSNQVSRQLKYRMADRTIVVSEFIRQLLVKEGVPDRKMATIPDCVPINEEESRDVGLESPIAPTSAAARAAIRKAIAETWEVPENAAWIGNMAALVPHKDQATLIRSMATVRREISNAELFVIGEGPLRQELETLAKSLGVDYCIHFTGRQSDPIRWLQALDLFVLSSWGEGMGSVLLEAMACRLPIVATTAGGIPEVIEDRRTGLLVLPRDFNHLAEAIVELLRNKTEAERFAENGLSRLQDFSISRCGQWMEDEYKRVDSDNLSQSKT